MAMIPPISPAIPTPIQGQPQGFAAAKAEGDTKRVTGASAGAESGQSRSSTNNDGNARERSERSGQFSDTGTRGTRGGDAGMLSNGAQAKADGSREGQQERAAERAQAAKDRAPAQTVRTAAAENAPSEPSFVDRILELKPSLRTAIIQEPTGVPDTNRVKMDKFMERLNEVRSAQPDSAPPVATLEGAEGPDTDSPTQFEPPGRYDKRA